MRFFFFTHATAHHAHAGLAEAVHDSGRDLGDGLQRLFERSVLHFSGYGHAACMVSLLVVSLMHMPHGDPSTCTLATL